MVLFFNLFLFDEMGGGVWERDALLNICNALWDCAFRLILFLFHILSLVMFDNQRYTRLHDYFIMTICIYIVSYRLQLKSNMLFKLNFLKVKTLYIYKLKIGCVLQYWMRYFSLDLKFLHGSNALQNEFLVHVRKNSSLIIIA